MGCDDELLDDDNDDDGGKSQDYGAGLGTIMTAEVRWPRAAALAACALLSNEV
jgi:hypothetical protein